MPGLLVLAGMTEDGGMPAWWLTTYEPGARYFETSGVACNYLQSAMDAIKNGQDPSLIAWHLKIALEELAASRDFLQKAIEFAQEQVADLTDPRLTIAELEANLEEFQYYLQQISSFYDDLYKLLGLGQMINPKISIEMISIEQAVLYAMVDPNALLEKLRQLQRDHNCVQPVLPNPPATEPERQRRTGPVMVFSITILLLLGLGLLAFVMRDRLFQTVNEPISAPVRGVTVTPDLPDESDDSEPVEIILTDEPSDEPTDEPSNEPSDEATDEPTEEPCEETGRYCTCEGAAYSIVVCADGSRTDTPTGTCAPDPAQCGGTDGSTNDPCANNGGLQYSGQVCTCQGQINLVIICADGAKTDTITTEQCTPDPAQCNVANTTGGGSGGSSGCTLPGPPVCTCEGYDLVCRDPCGNETGRTIDYCAPK